LKSTHSAQYRDLLARIRSVRQARGITQQELARRLGRPQSYVSKVELGERRIDVVEYLHLMRAIEGEPLALLRDIERAYRAGQPRRRRRR
jgi:transcriptional regulator with XRE-family HTH domain